MDGDECVFSFSTMDLLVVETDERIERAITKLRDRIEFYTKQIAAVAAKKNENETYKMYLANAQEELAERLQGTFKNVDVDSEGWISVYDYESDFNDFDDEFIKSIKQLEKQISSLGDALEIIFGNHCQVTLLRDKNEFNIDDYDHD
jgi:hypothetical protein